MNNPILLPNLFRTEYRNMVSALSYSFGIKHIQVVEDIVSDTFLAATEVWSVKGTPDNPRAWLYAVAKNKIRNYVKRDALFETNIVKDLSANAIISEEFELDLSVKNIADSQLAMIFTICNPINSPDAQIALALNLLCGFGVREIADAFLTNKEVIYKRINRSKEKLKEADIAIRQPTAVEIEARLPSVLITLYLLFSEGYYSMSQNTSLRKDLCEEAMRLTMLLIDNPSTATPAVKALYALMCFHASRFNARQDDRGETILYDDQDDSCWDRNLIAEGTRYLNLASEGETVSRYHLEAGIAYWHTQKKDTAEKWRNILDLYNHLLVLEYSPIAALNRTYALSKTHGKQSAIAEAEKLRLTENYLYHCLLGNLYTGIDDGIAVQHYNRALALTDSEVNKAMIQRNIQRIQGVI